MGHGLVERLEAVEGVGPGLGRLAEVIEEPGMRRAEGLGVVIPELDGEVLADEGVRVQGDLVKR